jgi:hypothetical protein
LSFWLKGTKVSSITSQAKKGNPQFCAREDVGKSVLVPIDRDGESWRLQRVFVESFTRAGLTDDAACTCGACRWSESAAAEARTKGSSAISAPGEQRRRGAAAGARMFTRLAEARAAANVAAPNDAVASAALAVAAPAPAPADSSEPAKVTAQTAGEMIYLLGGRRIAEAKAREQLRELETLFASAGKAKEDQSTELANRSQLSLDVGHDTERGKLDTEPDELDRLLFAERRNNGRKAWTRSKNAPIEHALLGSFGGQCFPTFNALVQFDLKQIFDKIPSLGKDASPEKKANFCRVMLDARCRKDSDRTQEDDRNIYLSIFSNEALGKMLHWEMPDSDFNEYILFLLRESVGIVERGAFKTGKLREGSLVRNKNDMRRKHVFGVEFFNRLFSECNSKKIYKAGRLVAQVDMVDDSAIKESIVSDEDNTLRRYEGLFEPGDVLCCVECHDLHTTSSIIYCDTGVIEKRDSLGGARGGLDSEERKALDYLWDRLKEEKAVNNQQKWRLKRVASPSQLHNDCMMRATLDQIEFVLGTTNCLVNQCQSVTKKKREELADGLCHDMRTWILLATMKEASLLHPEFFLPFEEVLLIAALKLGSGSGGDAEGASDQCVELTRHKAFHTTDPAAAAVEDLRRLRGRQLPSAPALPSLPQTINLLAAESAKQQNFHKVPRQRSLDTYLLANHVPSQKPKIVDPEVLLNTLRDCLSDGRSLARPVDSYIKNTGNAPNHSSLRVICMAMKTQSLERAAQIAIDYVNRLIYAANLACSFDQRNKVIFRPILEWIVAQFLPNAGDLYQSQEEKDAVRQSVICLLYDPFPPKAAAKDLTVSGSEVIQQGTSVSADGARRECEERGVQCFKCFRTLALIIKSKAILWVCQHEVSGSKICNMAYCTRCLKKRRTDPASHHFRCTFHQTRPEKGSMLFSGPVKCWDCPLDTIYANRTVSVRTCQYCNKGKCPDCGLFDPQWLSNKAQPFTCAGCYLTSRDRERPILGRLRDLLFKFCGALVEDFTAHRHMDASKTIDYTKLYAFAHFVTDVHAASHHHLAAPYIRVLMDINIWLINNRKPMIVTTPSQHIRIKSGTWESRKEHEKISKAYCAELVRNFSGDGRGDGRGDQPWSQISLPEGNGKDTPSMVIWMHDCSRTSPSVSLASYQLTKLDDRGKFGSIFLCGRELSREAKYDQNDGAVKSLIEHFEKKGNLKLFAAKASDDEIHDFVRRFDIILDLTCISSGNISGVLSRPRTAMAIAYLGYPSCHYGIYDWTLTSRNLLHRSILHSKERERFIFLDHLYPSVGNHNGYKDIENPLVSQDGPPLLLFLGDPNKLDDKSLFAYLDILSGTDKNLDSNNAILMIMQGSEENMMAVERWRNEYNAMRPVVDVIAENRIQWIPFRTAIPEYWAWLRSVSHRAMSVSSLAAHDVNTTANDALACWMPHLAMRTDDQDWPTLVAASCVEQAGLGDLFVANGVKDFVGKGILRMLNVPLRKEASAHLRDVATEDLGHFNKDANVLNLETGIYEAYKNFCEADGDRALLRDVDVTTIIPPRPIRQFSSSPSVSLESETISVQFQRILCQYKAKVFKLSNHSLQLVQGFICRFVHLHHLMGFRNMQIEGIGSTSLCVKAEFRGKCSEYFRVGAPYALKASHQIQKIQQENRLITDPIVKSANCFLSAGLRRNENASKEILPEMIAAYKGGNIVCILRGNKIWQDPKSPALSRPIMTCGIFEFIEGRALPSNEIFQNTVSQYRDRGIITDNFTRIVQAVLFSAHFLHSKKIVYMDYSFNNLALIQRGFAFIVVCIDTGGSLVYREGQAAVQAVRSDTLAFEDIQMSEGTKPAPALNNQTASKRGDTVFLNAMQVCNSYREGQTGLTCLGTDTFRDEEMLKDIKEQKHEEITFEFQHGQRWDGVGCTLVGVQMIHPAPKTKEGREVWKQQLRLACTGPDKMFEFLKNGSAVPVERPDVLQQYAALFYSLLRPDWQQRISIRDALLKKVLTTDTLPLELKRKLDEEGVLFAGGNCPVDSIWHETGVQLPPLLVLTEGELGTGVQTTVELKKDQLVCLYVGSEVSDTNDLPPSRRTTHAMHNSTRIHAVSNQTFEWLQQHSIAGPLLNAASIENPANIAMNRHIFWRDGKGLIYIAMFAKDDIQPGTFLRWRYNWREGAGGAHSYMFPDD